MDTLLQKFPMVCVDKFKLIDGETYYRGIKNFSIDGHYVGYIPILCLEGMGQTVEYNLRTKLNLSERKLMLAAVKEFEILAMDLIIDKLEYHVTDIQRQLGFFTSNIVACNPVVEKAVIMRAEIVHKLKDSFKLI
ncbi:MAG: hypothetical protein BWY74_00215 [Firmicutes bacterium ADurb.Bin419]|nr:MAG: hypothetical protein BWY74_00215 [Firmicutes bacterium ADurb.Bin419]